MSKRLRFFTIIFLAATHVTGLASAKDSPQPGTQPKQPQANADAIVKNSAVPLLADEMVASGYLSVRDQGIDRYSLGQFTHFGTKQNADKFSGGDQFDRLDVEQAARKHRTELSRKRFRIAGLQYEVEERGEIAVRGLFLRIVLPLRVKFESRLPEKRSAFDGMLCDMHGLEANLHEFWFLTKDKTLRECLTGADTNAVAKNGGIFYHPERPETELLLVMRDEIDRLKAIARNAQDYLVEIEIENLAYEVPLTWGFFHREMLNEADRDCERIRMFAANRTGASLRSSSDEPAYFLTKKQIGSSSSRDQPPEIVQARLTSLKIISRRGLEIGAYSSSGFDEADRERRKAERQLQEARLQQEADRLQDGKKSNLQAPKAPVAKKYEPPAGIDLANPEERFQLLNIPRNGDIFKAYIKDLATGKSALFDVGERVGDFTVLNVDYLTSTVTLSTAGKKDVVLKKNSPRK